MPSPQCRDLSYFRRYAADLTTATTGRVDLPALSMVCLGDRLMTTRQRILPLLERGVWVVCDRYLFTALAELLAVECAAEDYSAVKAMAGRFPAPDLAILTDVSAEEALRRVRLRRSEKNVRVDPDHLRAVVRGFHRVATENGLLVVSTEHDPPVAFERIRLALDEVLASRLTRRLVGKEQSTRA
jgi:dTMP kinase